MTELTVTAIKREDGLYHFNHPYNDTIEELLCNGTENVIDTHYFFLTGREPKPGDEIEIYLTDKEPISDDDWDTFLTFIDSDEEGSTYLDEVMCEELWLCKWLDSYFGNIPNTLWVRVYEVNKGLNAFVDATGMRKMINNKK